MIKNVVALLIVWFFASPLQSQQRGDLQKAASIEAYRPVGDRRTWLFFSRDSTFGALTSTITESVTIDNEPGYMIEEIIEVDYTKIGGTQPTSQRRQHFVTRSGGYLGDRITLKINDLTERIELTRRGDSVSGFFTRSGSEIPQNYRAERDLFAWDQNYVDQLELFLAMSSLRVGDPVRDSIFQPLTGVKSQIAGTVEDFFYHQLYRDRFDSVFYIRLTEPVEADLYFTADRRLVKVNLVNLDVRIYQDTVQQVAITPTEQKTKPSVNPIRLLLMSPHYALSLLFCGLSLLMFMGSGYRWAESYVGFLIAGLIFLLTLVSQLPLQNMIVSKWLLPAIYRGESLYFWALAPSVAIGIIQELLKYLALTIVILWRRPKPYRYVIIGAFCGAGFGFAEACYQTGTTLGPLFTTGLIQRGILILFHVAAGAVLGRAVASGVKSAATTIFLLVAVNASIRYLPTFVQQGDATLGIGYLGLGGLVILFVGFALLKLRRR